MSNKSKKVGYSSLYIFVISVAILYFMLTSTMFYVYIPNMTYPLFFLLSALVLLDLLAKARMTMGRYLLYISALFVMIGLFIFGSYKVPILICGFMITGRRVDFDRILKSYVKIVGTITIIVVALSQIGFIEDVVYYSVVSGLTRHSCGFIYPTDFVAHVFFLISALVYLDRRNDFSFLKVVAMIVVAYVTFLFSHTRLDSGSIVLLALVYIIIHKKKRIWKIEKWVLCISPLVFSTLSLVCSFMYDSSNAIWNVLNVVVSNRLYYMKEAVDMYEISLFGSYVEMHGHSVITANLSTANFYIDNSYLNICLRYGALVLLLFVVLYCVGLWKASKAGNMTWAYITFMLLANCVIAHHLADISYNIFLLSLFSGKVFEPFDLNTGCYTEIIGCGKARKKKRLVLKI